MNLLEIRKWFVQDSGRFDLVGDMTSYADNGADRYINAGLRWLDRQVEIHNQYGKFFREMSIGTYMVALEGLRSVTSVYVRKEDGTIKALEYKSEPELRQTFNEDFSKITTGTPLYYGILNLHQYDEADTDPPDDEGLTSSTWKTNDGILIAPPGNETLVVIVEGKFRSSTLASDEDENFWSVNEPSVLVKAGLRELEAFYRNTAGVQDWTASLMGDLFGIEKDYVEKMYNQFDQMEG